MKNGQEHLYIVRIEPLESTTAAATTRSMAKPNKVKMSLQEYLDNPPVFEVSKKPKKPTKKPKLKPQELEELDKFKPEIQNLISAQQQLVEVDKAWREKYQSAIKSIPSRLKETIDACKRYLKNKSPSNEDIPVAVISFFVHPEAKKGFIPCNVDVFTQLQHLERKWMSNMPLLPCYSVGLHDKIIQKEGYKNKYVITHTCLKNMSVYSYWDENVGMKPVPQDLISLKSNVFRPNSALGVWMKDVCIELEKSSFYATFVTERMIIIHPTIKNK